MLFISDRFADPVSTKRRERSVSTANLTALSTSGARCTSSRTISRLPSHSPGANAAAWRRTSGSSNER